MAGVYSNLVEKFEGLRRFSMNCSFTTADEVTFKFLYNSRKTLQSFNINCSHLGIFFFHQAEINFEEFVNLKDVYLRAEKMDCVTLSVIVFICSPKLMILHSEDSDIDDIKNFPETLQYLRLERCYSLKNIKILKDILPLKLTSHET